MAALSASVVVASPADDRARAEPAPGTVWRTAQLGPPIRLGPPARRPPDEQPAPSQPAAESAAPEATPAGPAPAVPTGPLSGRARAVEVDTLASVDPDSVGLLDPSQGGFGADLWQGTDRALIERLLPMLAAATPSRFVRDLTLKLLLSRATAPRGAPGGRSLLTLRVERLLALAEVGPAVELLRLAPAETASEAHARVEVESLFFQNDNAGACAKVRGFVRQHRGGFWQQANAFCLALSGDHARSSMVADILRERGADIGPAFYTLVDALAGDEYAVVKSLPDPGALKLAMMRAANRRLPDDAIASGRPDVLRAVALSPNADLGLRLDAAERAFAVGAVSADELTELYGAVEFGPGQLANPLTTAQSAWGPRARALLLRAASGADQATARAEILRRAWDLSRDKGGHAVMLGASVPILAAIEPAAELMWFAADAARTLFAAGRTTEAMAWYRLAEGEAETSAEARAAAEALWPLAQIADAAGELPWRPDGLAAWWAATREAGGDGARARALMVFSVLQALGEPVAPATWTGLLGETMTTNAIIPDAALWHALGQAAEKRQLGLTVLLALLALGEQGARAADPLTVTKAIEVLESVGLEREARVLGLEAVSGVGP